MSMNKRQKSRTALDGRYGLCVVIQYGKALLHRRFRLDSFQHTLHLLHYPSAWSLKVNALAILGDVRAPLYDSDLEATFAEPVSQHRAGDTCAYYQYMPRLGHSERSEERMTEESDEGWRREVYLCDSMRPRPSRHDARLTLTALMFQHK